MLIIILLSFFNSLSAQYFPFINDGKMGYIDINGEIKIEAKLDTKAEYFLSRKGKYDYLLGMTFPDYCYFNDSFAVFKRDKWFWILFPYKTELGIIDTNSNAVIFDDVKRLYPIINQYIRFDYYDTRMPNNYSHNIGIMNLERVLKYYRFREIEIAEASEIKNELQYAKYIYVGDLIDDRILIYEYISKDITDIYFLNKDGKRVIELTNAFYVDDFSDSLALVKEENDLYFIDLSGKRQFPNLTNIENAISFNSQRAFIQKNGKFHLIDKTGNIISKNTFDFAYPFVNNYAKVKIDNKYYLIDNKGNIVLKDYAKFGDVYNGVVPVLAGDKWRLYNLKTEKLLFEEFDAIYNFKNGLALAWREKQIFYINVEAEVVFEAIDKRGYEKKIANLIDRLN